MFSMCAIVAIGGTLMCRRPGMRRFEMLDEMRFLDGLKLEPVLGATITPGTLVDVLDNFGLPALVKEPMLMDLDLSPISGWRLR